MREGKPITILTTNDSGALTADLQVPRLIQAGMGARISSARLANTASRLGALGVVSSVGLRHIIVEEVRAGIEDTIEIARAFPLARYIDELLEYAPGGKKHKRPVPMDSTNPLKSELPKRLSAICSFVEVFRAKRGHRGMIGINVMWKASLTVLPSIYGAMLAGVDALLCGAGVPMEMLDISRRVRENQDIEYKPLHGTNTHVSLRISEDETKGVLQRFAAPKLIPILSNYAFPRRILDIWAREYGGERPFAFVLENHAAGGHNAPPRNKQAFAEPDEISTYFDKACAMGVPIYVAGAGSSREDFLKWIERGAYGLQVGSRFALCEESGMREDLRLAVINENAKGQGKVATSLRLSPTGYPFKYAPLKGTLSDEGVYADRPRICNKGYLLESKIHIDRHGKERERYICSAMPGKQYVKLGGAEEELDGRHCLCNALLATAALGDEGEMPLVTLGQGGTEIQTSFTARDIIEDIMTPEHVACMERKLAIEPTLSAL